ncbi:MAG TPA: hypothetical protein VK404_18900 [Spirosoma sp.]|jgi:hypothetical protein|nr:hypothetical protein [Spirosoma sp.]
MKRLFILCALLPLTIGCGLIEPDRYTQGTFPETPVNLGDINSVDDDYNSTSHSIGNVMALVFSSKNRGRTDFNFIHKSLDIRFDLKTGKLTFDTHPYGGLDVMEEQSPLSWATQVANSNANELGPYVRSYTHDLLANNTMNGAHYGEYLMLFASDRTGNLDIYLTHNYQTAPTSLTGSSSRVSTKQFIQPVTLSFLNSSADDAYPSFDQTYKSIYFTSNRSGSFDIYRANLPALSPANMHTALADLTNVSIERVTDVSSAADDKCPFISGNTLVFSSNRLGGYGGYDLYYSHWTDEHWSTPVNYGPSINTSSDEYRPILCSLKQFSNQLMIFSSNRPGGQGGFDLYRVGVPK